jgi:hypothetical protein
VLEKFQVVESAVATRVSRKSLFPTGLALKAVLEVNATNRLTKSEHFLLVLDLLVVLEGPFALELLQTENDVLLGGILPGVSRNELSTDGGVFLVLVDSIGRALNAHDVAGIEEGLRSLGRDCSCQSWKI